MQHEGKYYKYITYVIVLHAHIAYVLIFFLILPAWICKGQRFECKILWLHLPFLSGNSKLIVNQGLMCKSGTLMQWIKLDTCICKTWSSKMCTRHQHDFFSFVADFATSWISVKYNTWIQPRYLLISFVVQCWLWCSAYRVSS